MTAAGDAVTEVSLVLEGRIGRKTSNALTMTFQDGPDHVLATAQQSAGDGKGTKFATLLGFKNGGPGKHLVTYDDGRSMTVHSREKQPTVISNADGSILAVVERGKSSVARDAAGREVLRFSSDPVDARTPEVFRVVVSAPDQPDLGRLDVIRKVAGWSLVRLADAAWNTYLWWDHAGQSLPIPILGTRLSLRDGPTTLQRDVLVAACVDIAVGLRPYIAEMD